ncbi:Uncharacterized protein FKW44_006734 [Caligus rogercresseyi]|uniref:CCHC-type domain-containing protein n=1 Tax=Caligus rogercresseyi TaxID=217165 RepID=A0A7T8KDS8_CALRO|nr:Uncharacterized protein FKW44_006734 [Caligus rogercresseyi]
MEREKKRAEEKFEAVKGELSRIGRMRRKHGWSIYPPHALVSVIGEPRNIPVYLPIDQHIRPLYFTGRTKQCAKCYGFGHLIRECPNRSKSPYNYRRWLARRMKRRYEDGTPVPITINIEDKMPAKHSSRRDAPSSPEPKVSPMKRMTANLHNHPLRSS